MDCCISPTEAELQYRSRIRFYEKQQSVFLNEMNARWRLLHAHIKSLSIAEYDDGMQFLFEQVNGNLQPNSFFTKFIHGIGQLLGFGLGINISVPFAANTFNVLSKYIPPVIELKSWVAGDKNHRIIKDGHGI